MKTRIVLLTMLLIIPAIGVMGDTGEIEWLKYKEGMTTGMSQGKKIFLNFYADWCQYCKIMETKTYKNKDVIKYINSNFIPIKINSDLEKKTASSYNVRGLPTTLFLSEKGERIGSRPGYISAEEMLVLLKYISSGSYESMSLDQFVEKKTQ